MTTTRQATPLEIAEHVNTIFERRLSNMNFKITTPLGYECRVTIEPSLQGLRASSIAFAPDSADVVAETHGDTQYVDYCHNEIVYLETAKLLKGLEDPSDIWDELEALDIVCTCDD